VEGMEKLHITCGQSENETLAWQIRCSVFLLCAVSLNFLFESNMIVKKPASSTSLITENPRWRDFAVCGAQRSDEDAMDLALPNK